MEHFVTKIKIGLLQIIFCFIPLILVNAQTPEEKIIEKERSVLDRWKQGDTFGFIEVAADDITYFDPSLEKRIDGKKEFSDFLGSFNGTFSFPRYELLNPKVQLFSDIGILTFNFVGYSTDGKTDRWNSTEVYKFVENDWKIISSHWSRTKPQ
jgi:hypothetical protein